MADIVNKKKDRETNDRLFIQPRMCGSCGTVTKNKYCEVCGNKLR